MASKGIEYNAGDQPFVKIWIGDPSGDPVYLGVMPDGEGNHIGSLLSFTFQHKQGNVGEVDIELFDPTHGDIEDKIFASKMLNSPADGGKATGSPVLGFQFGWASGAKSLKWIAHVIHFTANFDLGSGTRISIRAVASPGILQSGRSHKCWAEGTPIQTIVDHYANLANLNPSVINPDAKDLSVDLAQGGQSNLSFLKNILAKQILSKSTGRGGYVFNVDGSNKKLEFLQDGTKLDNTEWTFIFGVEQESTLRSFEATLNSDAIRSLGGHGVKTPVFDTRDKTERIHVINDTTAQGKKTLEKKISPASSYPKIIRHGKNDAASIAYAESKFHALNMTNVTGSAVLLGNPSMLLSDIVSILVPRKRGTGELNIQDIRDLHPSSGRFFILKISHIINSEGAYHTELALMKKGAKDAGYGGSATTKGTLVSKAAANVANQSILKSNNEARIRLQASELAKKISKKEGS